MKSPVTKLVFHPQHEIVAIGTESTGIQLFDYSKNRLVAADILRADNPTSMTFSESGDQLFVVTRRKGYQQYTIPTLAGETKSNVEDINVPEPFSRITREARNFEFSEVSRITWPENPVESTPVGAAYVHPYLVGSFRAPVIGLFVWDSRSGKLMEKISPRDSSYIRSVAISADANWLVHSPNYGEVHIKGLKNNDSKPFVLKHRRSVSSIAIDRGVKRIATATFDCSIRVFDFETGALIAGPMRHDSFGALTRHFCRFSNDGARIVSWGQTDNRFRVWDSDSGDPVALPLMLRGKTRFAQFHPVSDEFLLTISELEEGQYLARIWSAETGIPITPVFAFDHFPSVSEIDLPPLELPTNAE